MLVATPLMILTVHCVFASRGAVAAVSVIVAVAEAELAAATVKVVVPHPEVVGVDNPLRVKYGTTITKVSDTAIRAFALNMYETVVAIDVVGDATNNVLTDNSGTTNAVERNIAVCVT
jgi:hypothetical protein